MTGAANREHVPQINDQRRRPNQSVPMKQAARAPTKAATGYCFIEGKVKISTSMPFATFEKLKQRALQSNVSIASMMRDYIELGLEIDEDCS